MERYIELTPLQAAPAPEGAGSDRLAGTAAPQYWRLTPSESRVVRLLASARTTAEISKILGLSVHTVRTHVKRAMAKAGVRSQVALVARALGASR
jgi:DNA-binding CsgD family transcriptional regulator